MTAKYQFYKNPPSGKEDESEKDILHARIVNGSTVSFKSLCERIAVRSTFSEGEVAGIMSLFQEELTDALKEGDSVELEGIGSFSVTLKCPPIQNPKEIRAESIHFSRIIFKACKELRREMQLMKVEKGVDRWKKRDFTVEQRRSRILAYLAKNPNLQSSDCMGLNDCSRYMAQEDLKYLYGKGLITRLGGPRVAIYVLTDKPGMR